MKGEQEKVIFVAGVRVPVIARNLLLRPGQFPVSRPRKT